MLVENVRQALESIKSNRLRNGLTIGIIAFGIAAIVGVMTSIDAVKWWMKNSLLSFGSNSFIILNREATISFNGSGRRVSYPPIRERQALDLKEKMAPYGKTSLFVYGVWGRTAKYGNRTTNPNIDVDGHDENLIGPTPYVLDLGRVFTTQEVEYAANVCILGHEIRAKLFPNNENPLGKMIYVSSKAYRVIGTFAKKGGGFGGSGEDRTVVIPYTTHTKDWNVGNRSFRMAVMVDDVNQMPVVEDIAVGTFRLIRGLRPSEANNFGIVKSDAIVKILLENLAILSTSAWAIAFITLFGASIGLMNSMLVSVTERIREIGVRKAMGASSRVIQQQFLVEAITITQLGGLFGIVLGILLGNLVGALLSADIQIPWMMMLFSVAIGFVVGILSGWIPARRAARLDPIESLRYE